jgi:hypothetical protein
MIRNAAGSKLAASRPDGTTAVAAFTAAIATEITAIFVANVSSSGRTFRIFHAAEGGSFDLDTALYYDVTIAANTTLVIQSSAPNGLISMEAGDIIGVRTSAADDLNFTLYGVTADVSRQLTGR